MEFADGKCRECGFKFSGEGPEDSEIIKVKEPYTTHGREVEFVGPCPSCGKDVPLWAGTAVESASTEPTEPSEPAEEPIEPAAPDTEPAEPEPTTEPAEPVTE